MRYIPLKQFALALLFFCSIAAFGDTVRGVVRNGTTRKPSAGDDVILKRIGNGMEDAGKTKTNARGEFTFDVPASPQPYLVWVRHQDVTYTGVVRPGGGPVAVQVFDASAGVKDITVQEHVMVIQSAPGGNSLNIDELYTLNNESSPPRSKNGQHTFDFYLPEGAQVQDTAAQPAGNMALKTPAVPDKAEKGKYFFGFPLRPGQTQFQIRYSLPYSGKLAMTPRLAAPVANMLVVTPNSISFVPQDGSVYSPTSDPQLKNVTLYLAKNVQPQQNLGFQIEGTGELPRDTQSGGAASAEGGPQQGAAEGSRPGGGLGVPNEKPDPLHNGQWLFLGVLTIFLAAGAVFVYTSQAGHSANPASSGSKPAQKDRPAMLLEAMKEEVFQLESDRLQGRITAQEYEASKAALDKTLQRAVQRQSAAAK